MRVSIKKWGNSAAIRLPSSIINSVHMKINSTAEMIEEDGKIIIFPVNKYHLGDLLNGITPENNHDEISFGDPVGREIL